MKQPETDDNVSLTEKVRGAAPPCSHNLGINLLCGPSEL